MSFDQLLQHLESALRDIPEELANRLGQSSAREVWRARLALAKLELTGPLEELLGEGTLAELLGEARAFVNGARSTHPHTIASWLLRRALQVGPHQALSELTAFTVAESFPAREVLVMDGVTVAKPVDLSSSLTLVPIEELQASAAQERSLGGGPWTPPRNRVALVRSFDHPIVRLAEGAPPPPELIAIQRSEDLVDWSRVMAIAPGVAPAIVSHWFEHDPDIPADNTTSAGGSSHGFQRVFAPRELDRGMLSDIAEWRGLLKRAPSALRATLRISLDHLNAARRRSRPVDRAIELGVAMESVLLRDLGSRSELSFRLATRAAWLLGSTRKSRERVFDLFRVLYEARSRAVHTGRLPETLRGLRVREALSEGLERVAALTLQAMKDPGSDLSRIHLG